jgi:hypothetical protein
MGLDVFQVQDVISEKGLYENSVNLVLDIINNPSYVNPLGRRAFSQIPPQMALQP